MKKLILTFVMGLGIVSVAFSQNWFIGAGAGFRYNKDSTIGNRWNDYPERETETERIDFRISPEIGYRLNNFDFGIRPIFQYSYDDSHYKLSDSDFEIRNTTNFGFGIGLFSRYKFVTFFNRLSILGRVDVNYSFSKGQSEQERESVSGGTNNRYKSKTEYLQHNAGVGIIPVIEFRVTDRLSLYSSFIGPLVRVEYSYVSNDNTSGYKYSDDSHAFDLTFPFIYNFS